MVADAPLRAPRQCRGGRQAVPRAERLRTMPTAPTRDEHDRDARRARAAASERRRRRLAGRVRRDRPGRLRPAAAGPRSPAAARAGCRPRSSSRGASVVAMWSIACVVAGERVRLVDPAVGGPVERHALPARRLGRRGRAAVASEQCRRARQTAPRGGEPESPCPRPIPGVESPRRRSVRLFGPCKPIVRADGRWPAGARGRRRVAVAASMRRQIIPTMPAATSRIASAPRISSGSGNESASPGFSLSSALRDALRLRAAGARRRRRRHDLLLVVVVGVGRRRRRWSSPAAVVVGAVVVVAARSSSSAPPPSSSASPPLLQRDLARHRAQDVLLRARVEPGVGRQVVDRLLVAGDRVPARRSWRRTSR